MSPVSVAFEGIERLTDADGNRLLIPTIEVNTYWMDCKRPSKDLS